MTAPFKLPEQNALAADAQLLMEAGASQELVIGVLAKGGLGRMDSIKLLSELTGMPLVEAKNAVQTSRAWRHTFARDSAFQSEIAAALQALREDERA